MKRIATLTLVVSLFATASAMAAIEGAWTASLEENHPDRMYFSVTRGRSHQNGSTMNVSAFSGLSAAQMNWRPQPGKWSIAQNLEHLNFGYPYFDTIASSIASCSGTIPYNDSSVASWP